MDRDRDEYQYYQYRRRRRRRRQVIGLSVLIILIVTLGLLQRLGKFPSITLSHQPPMNIPEEALFINSGLSRSTLTRTKVLSYDFKPPETSTADQDYSPDVVTALLEGDLTDPENNNQFPASLVQLSASPTGRGRLQISTIVSPSQQPKPPGGTYRGTIDIFAGQILRVPIVLYLAPREGPLAVIAFLLLVTGATIGLAVKWITESLTRLAAASWRMEDLRRSLGVSPDTLPLMAAARIQEIEEAIRRQDTDDNLDKAFAPLVSNISNLRSFATAIQNAEDEIRNQREMGYSLAWDEEESTVEQGFVETIARAESTRVERLRAVDWPWKNPSETVKQAQTLADQCSTATLVLGEATSGRVNAITSKVADLFRKGSFEDAVTLYRQPLPSDVTPPSEVATTPKKDRPRKFRPFGESRIIRFEELKAGPRGLVPWMARRPRAFAAAASVFVVSLVGLQLQYLDAAEFAGKLGDWLGLLLWAAVVELSGVSVLDVLGRLGTTNMRSGNPSRRDGPAEPPGHVDEKALNV